MRVETANNLVWDDNEPKCRIIHSQANGQLFAFVQCVDKPTGHTKRYWGAWSPNDPERSMLEIMSNGGKWPNLELAN